MMDQIDLENPKTLRDAVLLILKDTGDGESLTAADVASRLAHLQGHVDPRRVELILSQQASGKNRLIESRKTDLGANGVAIYCFLGPARSRSERTNARKAILGMNKVQLGR